MDVVQDTGSEPSLQDVVEACRQLRSAQAELRRVRARTDRVLLGWQSAAGLKPADASRDARDALLAAGWTKDDLAHAGVDLTGVLSRRPLQHRPA